MMWRHGALALCALQLLILPPPGCAQLDASWTPAGDGPLPLSDNYRSKLRKLCRLLDKDQLPAKMESKRRSIADQCAQLREADAAGDGSVGGPPLPGWVLGVIIVVVVGALLADRASKSSGGGMGVGQALGGGSPAGGGGAGTGADEAAVRAQRAAFLAKVGNGGGGDLAESLRQRQVS